MKQHFNYFYSPHTHSHTHSHTHIISLPQKLSGGTATVTFQLSEEQFALTDNSGAEVLYAGQHFVDVTRGNGDDEAHFSFTVQEDRVTKPRTRLAK